MSADKLLLWISARSSGSWPQFRAAVEELHVADSDGGETEMADDVIGQIEAKGNRCSLIEENAHYGA